MGTNLKLLAATLLLLLLLVFALQNAEPVPVRFLIWEGMVSRALLLLLVFVAGIFAGSIGWGLLAHRWRRRDGSVAPGGPPDVAP
jgi:uncharacterized integral membrane protein